MLRTEAVENRIDRLTTGLNPAVQRGQSAEFSMLLSLISTNQMYMPSTKESIEPQGSGFALPESSGYPDPVELNSAGVVERLNIAVNRHDRGDFAYFNSYIDIGSRMPRNTRMAVDHFEKVALMSTGRMVIDEIQNSRQQIDLTV